MFQNTGKRSRRRAWGIMAYVGANGGGKSAAMVWDSIPDLEAGRPVLSTVRIEDYENPRQCDDALCAEFSHQLGHYVTEPTEEGLAAEVRNAKRLYFEGEHAELEEVETRVIGVHGAAHPLWIPWSRWDQLLRFNFGRVLADEMTGIASSRDSMTLPSEVLNHLQQLRRNDIPFAYTCPDWARADKSLREPTQAVTVCTGFLPKAGEGRHAWRDGEYVAAETRGRVWKARRMFKWQCYEARNLDALTEGHKSDQGPEVVDWHWGPRSPAFRAYDTFAPVLQVGTTVKSGRCFRCGGKRKETYCGCADHTGGTSTGDRGRELATVAGASPGRRRALPIAG